MVFSDRYCTLELAKEFCGDIQGTDDDLFIDALIFSSSRAIDDLTNRYWGPSAVITSERVERIIGKSHNVFYTRYAPILSVQSLADDVRTYTQNTDYVLFPESGRVETYGTFSNPGGFGQLTEGLPLAFSRTPGAVQISYTVGQGASPTGEYLSSTPPHHIQLACAISAGVIYRERDRLGLMSRQYQDTGLVFDKSELPAPALKILRRSIRWVGI